MVLAALVGMSTAEWEVDGRFFVWVDAGDDERDFAATWMSGLDVGEELRLLSRLADRWEPPQSLAGDGVREGEAGGDGSGLVSFFICADPSRVAVRPRVGDDKEPGSCLVLHVVDVDGWYCTNQACFS